MAKIGEFLKGVRVLDLSRHLPGPLATLMLVDMGAEVLKVEPPAGDEMRFIGPEGANGRSAYFDAVNGGKSTCRLDLTKPDDRELLMKLAARSDVLLHSFRPGVVERLGVAAKVAQARNPRLIYAALNGFGLEGPLSAKAAHDMNYLSLAGQTAGTGVKGRPSPFTPPVADCAGALFAVIAILGALRDRDRTGRGADLDVALADAIMPLQVLELATLSATGENPRPEEDTLNGGAAYYRYYATRDGGNVALGAVEPKFWERFCRAAGREDWIARQAEALPQAALGAEVAQMFLSLTVAEAVARFEPVDCCFSAVPKLGEAVVSPHHVARGLIGRGTDGIWQARLPALADGAPPGTRPPLRELTRTDVERIAGCALSPSS